METAIKQFDAAKELEGIVAWTRAWFETDGPEAMAVIGLSGGKDSTIAAAILAKAIRPDRILGLIMPDGDMPDISDAIRAAKVCGIQPIIIDIQWATFAMLGRIGNTLLNCIPECDINRKEMVTNVPPRIRMTTLYMAAQALPCGGRVINTSNLSENYVGYSTKWGDAAGDVSLFGRLTATEVIAIGDAMDLPYDLVHKAPADGLTGKTDEDNYGFTYAVLDRYIRTGVCENAEDKEKIDKAHTATMHKRNPMPCYIPGCMSSDAIEP